LPDGSQLAKNGSGIHGLMRFELADCGHGESESGSENIDFPEDFFSCWRHGKGSAVGAGDVFREFGGPERTPTMTYRVGFFIGPYRSVPRTSSTASEGHNREGSGVKTPISALRSRVIEVRLVPA